MSQVSFVSHEDAEFVKTKKGTHNHYFGERGVDLPGPYAFMVNYGPGVDAPAHFHHVDQFQVFFGSPGSKYQRSEIGPLMLHYAQADTLYGPFGAGEEPLSFLTLRLHASSFQGTLPKDKDLLPRGVHHTHFHQDLSAWLQIPLPSAGNCLQEQVYPEQSDGVRTLGVLAGSGARITGPPPEKSGGQFYVVAEGEVQLDGKAFPRQSVGWCPSDAAPAVLDAGDEGVRLLILQFAVNPD